MIKQWVAPGTIVPLNITLWPVGIVFAAGEGLMLPIGCQFSSAPVSEAMKPQGAEDENIVLHSCTVTVGVSFVRAEKADRSGAEFPFSPKF